MVDTNTHYACILDTPLGKLGIKMHDDKVTALDYLHTAVPQCSDNDTFITAQLNAYFSNPQHTFSIPTAPAGTPFQQRVWQALTEIPAGTTRTYGALARQLHSSPRAVGQACRRNPIPIIVPCHRVVGASKLGGYAGDTEGSLFAIKQWLLQFEMRS